MARLIILSGRDDEKHLRYKNDPHTFRSRSAGQNLPQIKPRLASSAYNSEGGDR